MTDVRPDHVVFDELWTAARTDRRTGELAGPAHAAFLEFAQERGWNWAMDLETAWVLSFQGNPDGALALLTRCESHVPPEYAGYVHLFRSGILAEKENFDGAIEASRKALAQPGYLNPGDAWVILGVLLRKKDDFDGAIDACHQALAQPGYHQPAYAWIGMGNALAQKGDLDGAIEAFRKALTHPEYDTPDYAWFNLGNTFTQKGDWQAAIDAYRKALAEPKYATAARAWLGLGRAYDKSGNVELARAALENALASPDKGGKIHATARKGLEHFHAMARKGLERLVPAKLAEAPASKWWWQFWK